MDHITDYRIIFCIADSIQLFYCSGDYRIISLARELLLSQYYFTAPVTIVLFYCPGDYRIILLPGDYRIILLPR
jgi:hypothetical protein